ncbi:unnamed protein product [Adineta ricciae]|uniref:DUF1761 domain-containing protein n=1 Tax=Adineta ricciae TaxID=249248 RepID=A0A815KZP3_ADIRI|nr:unnamed protein product [Adineta ricciae]
MTTVNYGAVATCTLINIILGGLWYSPLLFAKPWAKLMGFDLNKMKNDPTVQKNAQKGYIISTVCHFIMVIILAYFIQLISGSSSWFDGMKIGFCCWLGFALTSMLPNHIFSKNEFSWKLAAINIGYPMVGASLAGAILGAWR